MAILLDLWTSAFWLQQWELFHWTRQQVEHFLQGQLQTPTQCKAAQSFPLEGQKRVNIYGNDH